MAKKIQTTHTERADSGYYRDILWMSLPLLAMAYYFYGWRPLILAVVALVVANLTDRVVAWVRSTPYDLSECSSEAMAMLLVLLMPASVPYYILVVAVLISVLLGKEVFGGYGAYPFHPAAVGYAAAAISWPEQMFSFPRPFADLPLGGSAVLEGLTPSLTSVMRSGGIPTINDINLMLGNYTGPLGTTATLVILACGLYLLIRRRVSLPVALGFLFSAAFVAFVFPRIGDVPASLPWQYVPDRLVSLKFELLSGAMPFAALFLINEPVTMPRNTLAKVLYGLCLGAATMLFRYYGVYETGACFALLSINAVSGWLDRGVMHLFAKREVRKLEGGVGA